MIMEFLEIFVSFLPITQICQPLSSCSVCAVPSAKGTYRWMAYNDWKGERYKQINPLLICCRGDNFGAASIPFNLFPSKSHVFTELLHQYLSIVLLIKFHLYMTTIVNYGGARGVMVIVVGNGHGDTSSNPGRN